MTSMKTLTVSNLTKNYGHVVAVDGLSFAAKQGRVTGFLGLNGSGKTTTLRVLLGLARPTSGSATIGGVPYRELRQPARTVGAVIDSMGFHPSLSAVQHLRALASAGGVDRARVDEVIALVGLAEAANRSVGGFSLGMRQRLNLAGALLGDPEVLIFDEPLNGLDPEGIRWVRELLRHLASQGRTRRRSVIVRIDDTGKVLGKKQVLNDPVEFALAMAEAGEGPEVALEAHLRLLLGC